MNKYWSIIPLLLMAVLFNSCQDQHSEATSFNDCRYQAPEAIFSSAIPDISQHEFELKDGIGVERVVIDESLKLTLIQTGCERITQEFEFSWPGDYSAQPSSFWVEQCAAQFYRLGKLGAPYLTFRNIGKAVESSATSIQLNTPVELQPGIVLSIEPSVERDQAILLVTLSERG